ncbi:anthranilate synthase component I family protein [Planctomicrobium sp. SH668]|uniref:anthranilate synthase component I family protein n=1 Tax=Planctomicrobium sp. SH668 TaxID=3448126 RepID=UPI003F5BE007
MNTLPYVHEFVTPPTVAAAFNRLSDRTGIVLFDSSAVNATLGRYSFLAAEPFATYEVQTPEYGADPFNELAANFERYSVATIEGLPPFQGGAAGMLSYELGGCFEAIPSAARDEFKIPVAVIGFYGWVLAWDHLQERCWFIGHGFPEEIPAARMRLAQSQLESVKRSLSGPELKFQVAPSNPWSLENEHRLHSNSDVRSNFTHPEYLRAVDQVIEYIRAGDIFQANLSQRLLAPATRHPVEQYQRLRVQNPATFSGYFAHQDWSVLSSSPERFLQVRGGEVSTRPIKGTRRRRTIPEADLFTRDELRESEKDRAENVMIVDLLRNDLSRVCLPHSIRVTELCSVEAYQTVTHLVSEVRGTLRPECSFWDLMRVTFPGGSITGAPKIRAMEIIAELEQVARGPYCGSLFYNGFDGTADSNILIRTMTQRHGWLAFSAGGGVVVQSDSQQEYEETLHKARGLLNSL